MERSSDGPAGTSTRSTTKSLALLSSIKTMVTRSTRKRVLGKPSKDTDRSVKKRRVATSGSIQTVASPAAAQAPLCGAALAKCIAHANAACCSEWPPGICAVCAAHGSCCCRCYRCCCCCCCRHCNHMKQLLASSSKPALVSPPSIHSCPLEHEHQ